MCRSAQNDGWLRCPGQPDPRPDPNPNPNPNPNSNPSPNPNPNPNPNPTLWGGGGLLSRSAGAVLSLRANLKTLHVRAIKRLVVLSFLWGRLFFL